MAHIFGIDHKYCLASAIAISTGIAAYSYYRLRLISSQTSAGGCPRCGCRGSSFLSSGSDVYESKKLLSEYMVFHYGTPEELIPYPFGPKDALDFPKRCAELCLKHYNIKEGIHRRALDIGCAVGRSTFELTRGVDEAIGIDYSHSFIDAAIKLKTDGQLSYSLVQEGDIFTSAVAEIPHDIDRNRARFEQGDACNLKSSLGEFDIVLAANLICRLHHPKDFLNRLTTLMPTKGSILVITAPYTWLREFTDKALWLGGYKDAKGNVVTGFEALEQELCSSFELVEHINMPFFIRETARKNQWTVAHATVWRRK